jgi:shikimate kinase
MNTLSNNFQSNIFLIGPMGSGKTAVGRQLAKLLDMQFYDSDAEIERITGVDIPFIFEKEGEAKFRERECEVIDSLTELNGIILATGGGAILAAQNRQHLQARGKVVYLLTSVEQQLDRVRHGRHRPLLHTADPEQRLRELLAIRAPLYESIATIIVPTNHRRVPTVAADILKGLHLGPQEEFNDHVFDEQQPQ